MGVIEVHRQLEGLPMPVRSLHGPQEFTKFWFVLADKIEEILGTPDFHLFASNPFTVQHREEWIELRLDSVDHYGVHFVMAKAIRESDQDTLASTLAVHLTYRPPEPTTYIGSTPPMRLTK